MDESFWLFKMIRVKIHHNSNHLSINGRINLDVKFLILSCRRSLPRRNPLSIFEFLPRLAVIGVLKLDSLDDSSQIIRIIPISHFLEDKISKIVLFTSQSHLPPLTRNRFPISISPPSIFTDNTPRTIKRWVFKLIRPKSFCCKKCPKLFHSQA